MDEKESQEAKLKCEAYYAEQKKKANTINILGTEYIIRNNTDCNDPKLLNCNGYVELYSKEIVLQPINNPDLLTVKHPEDFNKRVLRHEIVHAFLHEAGMCEWSQDKKLVDWISIQIPKMAEAMIKADCLKIKLNIK